MERFLVLVHEQCSDLLMWMLLMLVIIIERHKMLLRNFFHVNS